MIDIHSHILPGFDHGVRTFSETLELIRAFEKLGFTKIILTPHLDPNSLNTELPKLKSRYSEFIGEIEKENIKIEFILGSEIILDPVLFETAPEPPVIFELSGKKFQLIELSPYLHPIAFESYSNYLKKHSITPIIAHVERLNKIVTDNKLCERLKKEGYIFQVDILSLSKNTQNLFGNSAKKLLKENLIDMFASDCHSLTDLKQITEGIEYLKRDTPLWKRYFEFNSI